MPVTFILVEPALDGPVAVERAGRTASGRSRLGRGAYGVPGNLELPGYLGDRVALHPKLEYRISLGHADYSFLASLVDLRWQ